MPDDNQLDHDDRDLDSPWGRGAVWSAVGACGLVGALVLFSGLAFVTFLRWALRL